MTRLGKKLMLQQGLFNSLPMKESLQLKKQKLDQSNKDGGPIEESDGFVISDRNELMKKLLKKD